MRKLAILTFLSLDGVAQAPMMPDEDRTGGFRHGGWAREFMDDVMPQVAAHATAEQPELLFGRRTFDLFAAHWPTADPSEHASFMNTTKKYVATSHPDTVGWENAEPVSPDVNASVRALKEQEGPTLQVHGSCALIADLFAHDLVDELRLWIFPLILGQGKRIFDDTLAPRTLRTTKTEVGPKGTAMQFYERAAATPQATT